MNVRRSESNRCRSHPKAASTTTERRRRRRSCGCDADFGWQGICETKIVPIFASQIALCNRALWVRQLAQRARRTAQRPCYTPHTILECDGILVRVVVLAQRADTHVQYPSHTSLHTRLCLVCFGSCSPWSGLADPRAHGTT